MTYEEIMASLEAKANPDNVAGMARFGIRGKRVLGITVKATRELARKIKKDHTLAERLWQSGTHEARILASIIDEPAKVTAAQMDRWVADFDSWDVCDQVCGNLFDRTPFSYQKPFEWAAREEEYVRRAAFSLIAYLASHDKKAENAQLAVFFPLIARYASDERNFVKKAVNWALRQLGKRNPILRKQAMEVAREIALQPSSAARWVAAGALRELKQYAS